MPAIRKRRARRGRGRTPALASDRRWWRRRCSGRGWTRRGAATSAGRRGAGLGQRAGGAAVAGVEQVDHVLGGRDVRPWRPGRAAPAACSGLTADAADVRPGGGEAGVEPEPGRATGDQIGVLRVGTPAVAAAADGRIGRAASRGTRPAGGPASVSDLSSRPAVANWSCSRPAISAAAGLVGGGGGEVGGPGLVGLDRPGPQPGVGPDGQRGLTRHRRWTAVCPGRREVSTAVSRSRSGRRGRHGVGDAGVGGGDLA